MNCQLSPTQILRVITRLNNGGPAKQAVWLSYYLSQKGYDTVLAAGKTEANEDNIRRYAGEYGLGPLFIPAMQRSLSLVNDVRTILKLYFLIRKVRPGIIHTHMSKAGFTGRTAAIVYNALHRQKVRIVHTFHGHVFHSYFSRIKTSFFLNLERMLARKTTRIIAISTAQYRELHGAYRIGRKAQYSIVPLGIDYTPPHIPSNTQSNKNQGDGLRSGITVGMMGRIAHIKNYALAAVVGKQLHTMGIEASIVVAGGGEAKDLEELRKIGGARFIGNVEKPEDFWKTVDVAMITSKNEGTPVSLIEAMMSGIPYVAGCVGGIPDMTAGKGRADGNLIYYDNCVHVRGFDPVDFARAIRYFAENPEKRREAGRAARDFAISVYSIDRLVADIHTLYKEITV